MPSPEPNSSTLLALDRWGHLSAGERRIHEVQVALNGGQARSLDEIREILASQGLALRKIKVEDNVNPQDTEWTAGFTSDPIGRAPTNGRLLLVGITKERSGHPRRARLLLEIPFEGLKKRGETLLVTASTYEGSI